MVYPPKIEYTSPCVDIQVALPCNVSIDGIPLPPPLPSEAEIRDRILAFVADIQSLYPPENKETV